MWVPGWMRRGPCPGFPLLAPAQSPDSCPHPGGYRTSQRPRPNPGLSGEPGSPQPLLGVRVPPCSALVPHGLSRGPGQHRWLLQVTAHTCLHPREALPSLFGRGWRGSPPGWSPQWGLPRWAECGYPGPAAPGHPWCDKCRVAEPGADGSPTEQLPPGLGEHLALGVLGPWGFGMCRCPHTVAWTLTLLRRGGNRLPVVPRRMLSPGAAPPVPCGPVSKLPGDAGHQRCSQHQGVVKRCQPRAAPG